jgi:hypothetical protein
LLHQGVCVVKNALKVYEQARNPRALSSRRKNRERSGPLKTIPLTSLRVERQTAQHGIGDVPCASAQPANLVLYDREHPNPVTTSG